MRATMILAAVVSAAFFAFEAKAEAQCNTTESIRAQLGDKYKEKPVAAGVMNNGSLIEVYTSEGGGTWSIVITGVNGISCLVSAGEGWRALPAQYGQAL